MVRPLYALYIIDNLPFKRLTLNSTSFTGSEFLNALKQLNCRNKSRIK